jgi:hypothetical protein
VDFRTGDATLWVEYSLARTCCCGKRLCMSGWGWGFMR